MGSSAFSERKGRFAHRAFEVSVAGRCSSLGPGPGPGQVKDRVLESIIGIGGIGKVAARWGRKAGGAAVEPMGWICARAGRAGSSAALTRAKAKGHLGLAGRGCGGKSQRGRD